MSSKLVANWRSLNPDSTDTTMNQKYIFGALEPSTLSTYRSSAAAYLELFGERAFPVTSDKLITFIRFRTDSGLNTSTTRAYVYNICSYSCYLGHPKLSDEGRMQVDKALRSAMKVHAPPQVKRAPTFDLSKIRQILDYKILQA
jgi:hypothetical protein